MYALCTSLRVRMALSMSARLGGWRAWLRIFLGSPRSSFLAFKTTVSRGQRCGEQLNATFPSLSLHLSLSLSLSLSLHYYISLFSALEWQLKSKHTHSSIPILTDLHLWNAVGWNFPEELPGN